MARINLEDSLWTDVRFLMLSQKIGRVSATGAVVELWRLAQQYWVNDKLIPEDVFNFFGLPEELFGAGLAERRPNGIYAKGSEERFAWLIAKVKNGKKGGRPSENKDLVKPTETENNPLTLTPTPTLKEKKNMSADADLPVLARIWNEHRGQLPGVRGTNAKRNRRAEACWKQNPSTEYWAEIIRTMSKSAFCLGQNKTGWRADFDFLLQPETHLKVSEGKYGKPKMTEEEIIAERRKLRERTPA